MPSSRKKYNHEKLGRNLASLGLLPKGYRLNALTKNQRDRIVKLTHKYPGPARRPEEYTKRNVAFKTARTLRAAKYNVKFTGKKPVAVFAKHGASKLRLTSRDIERKIGGVKRISLVYDPKDVFSQAEEFFKRKKPGQYLMVSRQGGHGGMRINSMRDFTKYVNGVLKPRIEKAGGNWEEFRDELYIIEVGY